MSRSILVVEDDADLLEYLRDILTKRRYSVHLAVNGTKARKLFYKTVPDLILLDLRLPDIDGEGLLSEFKENNPETQIIVLTADTDPSSVARNLQNGADDFISKPFTAEELYARIQARLREKNVHDNLLSVGDLVIDIDSIEARYHGEALDLTQTEFELLKYLLENTNKVLTREMILSRIWASDPDVETRVVDVYIGYLRKKIDTKYNTKIIYSKRGYGYTIKDQTKLKS